MADVEIDSCKDNMYYSKKSGKLLQYNTAIGKIHANQKSFSECNFSDYYADQYVVLFKVSANIYNMNTIE